MKKLNFLWQIALPFAVILTCTVAFAEQAKTTDPVQLVISANKIEQKQSQIANSVIVLDQEQIQKSQRRTVADLLRTVPQLDVVSSGGAGGNTSIFIRGANAEHTLVLLNGIELNNPGSNARFYNFANISLADVEKIEILMGPQGSLYGSDAIGGVISIFTKESLAEKFANINSEFGSQRTFNNSAISGTRGDWGSINLSAERRETAGLSAQDNPEAAAEHDAYQSQTFSNNLNLNLSKNTELKLYGRFNDSRADIDAGSGFIPDDPNRVLDSTETLARAQLKNKNEALNLQQTLGTSYSRHSFSDRDYPDEYRPSNSINSKFKGRLLKFDYLANWQANENNTLVFGLETERETADSTGTYVSDFGILEEDFHPDAVRTNSTYLQHNYFYNDKFSSSQGLRFDSHDLSGDYVTYRIAPRYEINKTTALKASWATGFKAPSLYQLYSSFGNQDLDAEKSRGWEAGINKTFLHKKLEFEISYFQNNIDNLIDFDPQTFIFTNTAEAEISGVNSSAKLKLNDQLLINLGYTYIDARNDLTDTVLLRRARNKLSTGFDYHISDRFNFGSEVLFTGNRFDNDFSSFPAEQRRLPSYTVVNLFANYAITEEVNLLARVENLLDRSYEEILSFNTPGRLLFIGFNFKL